MIYLYSGTPGSGKSLHMAKMIFLLLKHSDCLVIGNFFIKKEYFTDEQFSRFIYVSNENMNPDNLINIALDYWKTHKAKNYRDAEQKFDFLLMKHKFYLMLGIGRKIIKMVGQLFFPYIVIMALKLFCVLKWILT